MEPYLHYCAKLRSDHRYRMLSSSKEENSGSVDFSTNDYLNLSRDPQMIAAAQEYASTFGIGTTGSRLLSGNLPCFTTLEERIAKDKKTDAALIFSSGHQANSNVLAALLDKAVLGQEPLVFFDKLNHSSLYQGVFLSGARLLRYPHLNLDLLEELLSQYATSPSPKFIISETLFGMDGDVVDLERLLALAKKYQAFLYLDEAHATGILGQHGYGLSGDFPMNDLPGLVMGTFSKGLGGAGAYIACSAPLRDYLVNRCSGFIYSTAPAPSTIGAATAAWERIPLLSQKRTLLLARAARLRQALQRLGCNTAASTTHIIPVILGADERVVMVKEALQQRGLVVSAVRSPTVPPGAARLRIAVTVAHTDTDIDRLIAALSEVLA